MKRVLNTLGAATLLVGLPLAAAADDDRHRGWRGHERHGHYQQPKYRHDHGHYRKHYQPPPVAYYPAPPRVVERPVYVPVPQPAPRPWPFNHVDIGFRVFF